MHTYSIVDHVAEKQSDNDEYDDEENVHVGDSEKDEDDGVTAPDENDSL